MTNVNGGPSRILVADDREDVRKAVRLLLPDDEFEVRTATSPNEVLREVAGRYHDVLLLDLNYTRDTTSGREGLDLIPKLRDVDPTLPILVMTAWGSVDGAVEAMKEGARDYIEKPWENEELLRQLRDCVDLRRALRRVRDDDSGEDALQRHGELPVVVARSPSMAEVMAMVRRVAPSAMDVLVTGEPGVGKEVVARWIHGLSDRSGRPLVTVDAGAVADGVVESELFGHVRGAFTGATEARAGYFEEADGGTLFLDEVGNMPPDQQAKLLRVLESGEFQRVGASRTRRVDVRVITATNTDLRRAIERGSFREDLYYRLNAIEIEVPPLRRRREDLPRLASRFLDEEAGGPSSPAISPGAMRAMLSHDWPGNVRQLRHALERATLLADDEIAEEHLGLGSDRSPVPGLEEMTLDEAERSLIKSALERSGGNVTRAAERLGISRSALYRRLDSHGVPH